MSNRYDLHSHSTASDGTLTPADLVGAAHAAGIRVLALTDEARDVLRAYTELVTLAHDGYGDEVDIPAFRLFTSARR